MSLKVRTIVVAAAVCLLAGTAQAADGLLIVQKMTTDGKTQTHQVQIENTRMRAEASGIAGATQVMIFRSRWRPCRRRRARRWKRR